MNRTQYIKSNEIQTKLPPKKLLYNLIGSSFSLKVVDKEEIKKEKFEVVKNFFFHHHHYYQRHYIKEKYLNYNL